MKLFLAGFVALVCSANCTSAHAGSLSVTPVTLDLVTNGDVASSITVKNAGALPVNVQVRAMRWTQPGGRDRLDPVDDIAVSPPLVQIQPGSDQVIRIVRVSHQPVIGEEAYRLLVDELPGSARVESTNVNLVVRQSIPVFYRAPTAAIAPLTFDLAQSGSATTAVGNNSGEVHQKILSLTIKDARGAVRYSRNGLAGYVLGRSSFGWPLAAGGAGPMSIQGRTEHGPINMTTAPNR